MKKGGMPCKICGNESREVFSAIVLKKFEASYQQCGNCGFTFAEDPIWLKLSYEESMNLGDTGQVQRLFYFSNRVKFIIKFLLNPSGTYLDYAGGYGLFSRRMRDIGFDFFWQDLYTQNLFSRGFEGDEKVHSKYEAITVFECFEHWLNPLDEISNLFEKTDVIIFSTNLITRPAPKEWWYYGFDHGQHISFFSIETMRILESKFSCKFYSKFGLHILSRKPISKLKFLFASYCSTVSTSLYETGNRKSLTATDHLKIIKQN